MVSLLPVILNQRDGDFPSTWPFSATERLIASIAFMKGAMARFAGEFWAFPATQNTVDAERVRLAVLIGCLPWMLSQ